MVIEFKRGGRKMSSKQFFDGITEDIIEMAMSEIEKRAHDIASTIIDPETGAHAEVIVRRTSKNSAQVSTSGSAAFARELERRLGFDKGDVRRLGTDVPKVYLAHATEDKVSLARPLARFLLENGIDVWLDEWEIVHGDSLVQKMEEGLENHTHFVVLLTPTSILKPWVRAEIDVGFTNRIDGKAKFIGLRHGVEIGELTPFLRSLYCPEVNLNDEGGMRTLIEDIFSISRKPELGDAPSFVVSARDGLAKWSAEARAVAKFLVETSNTGRKHDPQTDVPKCAQATGLSEEDVRLGVLDLEGSGLVERRKAFGTSGFWPTIGLFVEFDPLFKLFDNRADARDVAQTAYGRASDGMVDTGELKSEFPEWNMRRFNSALNVLEEIRAIKASRHFGDGSAGLSYQGMRTSDSTLRYLRRTEADKTTS